MTTVLKLGGSVLTEKDEPETVDEAALERAAAALAGRDDLVVVHGGGSFGHHHADRYGVSTTAGTHDAEAVRAIHGAMKRLNAAVVDALADVDVPPLPVHPMSAAHRDESGTLTLPTGQVRTMLAEGFVPVLHGDCVVHAGAGATVLSGDELVVAVADAVGADRVGVCSAVPGVYDESGDVVEHIDSFEAVADALGASEATDVSGGMAGKVRELLDLAAPAYVFDLDGLEAFLDGENPGTRID
ncbi:isopentenyl phosphate kinase [Natronomonas marina]|uniref:isopentenyl phosphate kinase n=1 Tax=Natronomonas marina TaxID=2961939 RepID=UPI0020C9B184|nr:isopentenyl phosphate kinase [Natronomonas marina]